MRRRAERAERRLRLLEQETDWQLLRLKELQQRETQLQHRLAEVEASRQFRQHRVLVAPDSRPPTLPASPEDLDRLLGLGR